MAAGTEGCSRGICSRDAEEDELERHLLSPLYSGQDSRPRNGATHIYVRLLSSVSPT